jgi:lantibiotic modifying enzyme
MSISYDSAQLSNFSRELFRSSTTSLSTVPAHPFWRPNSWSADIRFEGTPQLAVEQNTDFLQSAKNIAQRIEAVQKQNARGVYWHPETGQIETAIKVSTANTIFRWSTETILFLVQLANVTKNPQYLDTATMGADYLIAGWRDLVDKPGWNLSSEAGLNLSLYGGVAGVAVVLNETGKASGEKKYCEVAREITDDIVRAAKTISSGLAWSSAPGIAGDGNLVLFLLYAAREFQSSLYQITAERAGDHILELATNERHGGFSWIGFPALPGLTKYTFLPRFEDGTVGVAYVFARLYKETNKGRYLFAANQAALHLQNITTMNRPAESILGLPKIHNAGAFHGKVGTACAFFELFTITREPNYQAWAEQLAQVQHSSDLESLASGEWNTVSHYRGMAAFIDLILEIWAYTGRQEILTSAQRAARDLLSRETNLSGGMISNIQARTYNNPMETNVESEGFFAVLGMGSALLHIHLAEKGKHCSIPFPDFGYLQDATNYVL